MLLLLPLLVLPVLTPPLTSDWWQTNYIYWYPYVAEDASFIYRFSLELQAASK